MTRAEAALAQLDHGTARTVSGALSWLLPEDGDVDDILQLRLEEFLWYHLPLKWIADPQVLHETAWALGDFFERAGKPRYAGPCRSQDTHLLLDAWQTNRRSARRQMQRLIDQSGVYPIDTGLVTWSAVMGMAEFEANCNASLALERAIDEGRLAPGAPGWRKTAAQIVDDALRQALRDRKGTVLDTILTERAEAWSSGGSASRTRLLRAMLPSLLEPLEVPDDSGQSMEPLAWLLGEVGDGLKLTPGGRLPRSLLLRADSRYHWFEHHAYGSIRLEEDLQQVRALHDLSRRTRLVTLRNGRLSLSTAGRLALADPGRLWRVAVEGLFDPSEPPGDAAAIWSALLLSGAEGPVPERDAREQTVTILRERWHPTSGGVASPHELYWATWDFAVLAPVFGWVDQTGEFSDTQWTLTSAGRTAVRAGLRGAATAPRAHP